MESLDGGGGGSDNDQLIGPDTGAVYTITALDAGTATGIAGGFSDIENLTGGTSTDIFGLDGGTLSGTIDGGNVASDTLTADDGVATQFVITALDAGTVTDVGGGFSDIENFAGGTSADTIALDGGTLSGSITGGAGAAVDTLTADDGVATQFVINGADEGSITGIAGGFTDVENLAGGCQRRYLYLRGCRPGHGQPSRWR